MPTYAELEHKPFPNTSPSYRCTHTNAPHTRKMSGSARVVYSSDPEPQEVYFVFVNVQEVRYHNYIIKHYLFRFVVVPKMERRRYVEKYSFCIQLLAHKRDTLVAVDT